MAIFKRLDADANGQLTFEEWKASSKAKASPSKLTEIFTALDKDGDKAISAEEFAAQWKK